jgi:hemerythrin superfamily protein
MTPSITTMIRMDHTHVLALFHRYKADTPAGKKRALVRNACLALEIHAQLEEEIFYPALQAVMAGDDVLQKSKPEHDEMRSLIGQLRERSAADAVIDDGTSFDDLFLQFMRSVMHHVADEETRLLPAAERLLPEQLGDLGLEMTRRRVQLLKPHAGEIAATSMRSFPVGAATAAALLAGAIIGTTLLWRGKDRI